MQAEMITAVSGVAAAATAIAAAVIAGVAARFTKRSADAAMEQTRLQQEIRKDAAQPYVWVDVRPDEAQGTILNLVLGNSGPTFAHNIRATIAPELPHEVHGAVNGQKRLKDGIKSLGPGYRLAWSLGVGFTLLEDDVPRVHRVTIDADGPFGPLPQSVYDLNLTDLRETRDAPEGNLHFVRKAIKDVEKALTKRK